jgi:hypothetical protein
MTNEIPDPEVLDNDENSPGGLRATIDRQLKTIADKDAELDEMHQDKQARELADSKLNGPALKAVAKDLTRGDYTGDVTAEALREYAQEEYDWEPPDGDDDDNPVPNEVDEATQKRMDSQKTRDDIAASSHARGDGEESPESQQAAVDTKLDEGDVQGAVLDELLNKARAAAK